MIEGNEMSNIPNAAMEKIGLLEPDECILKTYECRIDARRGFLICTNKGIRFVQGGGKYDRSFQKSFETSYDRLEVGKEANTYLILTIEGTQYRKRLEPVEGPISDIEKILLTYLEIHRIPHLQDMRIHTRL